MYLQVRLGNWLLTVKLLTCQEPSLILLANESKAVGQRAPTSRVPDSVGLELGLRFCMSNKFSDAAGADGQVTAL